MTKKLIKLLVLSVFLWPGNALGADQVISIGVLAKRGPERCLEQWNPTAEYLSAKIPEYSFKVNPLDFKDIFSFVEKGRVDFILTNSAMYVELETRYGSNRIATMKNKRLDSAYTVFAGVIFCLKEQTDIRTMDDLKGKRFMAVEQTSFGGWQMAWRELKHAGMDPLRDFASMEFGGTHDAVVYAVLNGRMDAGTVRTDTLERMAEEKKIDVSTFHILNKLQYSGKAFPFARSTRLYPEWPMAKVKHTPEHLAETVTLALLEMEPESDAARAAMVSGWTIPANYEPVHDCLKELKIGPYKNFGKVTLYDVIETYWHIVSFVTLLIVVLTASVMRFIRLNKIVSDTNITLSQEMKEKELLYKQMAKKNEALKTAMSEVKQLSGLLPICSSCKKIRDDKGYWNQIESYLHDHSDAEFSHGICPECAERLYGKAEDHSAER